MKAPHETEIKLAVTDPQALQGRLAELQFRLVQPRHFESNRLYDFPDLRLRDQGCVLRLRFVDGDCLLTFKGPAVTSPNYKVRSEIETRVEAGNHLEQIFEKLELRQVFRYDKYRAVYRRGSDAQETASAELCYDETPIGDFVELEGPGEWIDEIAGQLGYSRPEYIKSSYVTLYLQKRQARTELPGDMIFSEPKS